jgi:hypothetical protein
MVAKLQRIKKYLQGIKDACIATVNMLCEAKISAELDSRDYCSPERKYSEWEMKGVPLRIEIGTKDLANEQVINVVLFFHLFYMCYFASTLYVQSTPNKLLQFYEERTHAPIYIDIGSSKYRMTHQYI